MPKIIVGASFRGHSFKGLRIDLWEELIKIDNGTLEEINDNIIITTTEGKRLLVNKNRIHSITKLRTIYWGSMDEICDRPFLFTSMNDLPGLLPSSLHEFWDPYFTPGEGGFSIMFDIE